MYAEDSIDIFVYENFFKDEKYTMVEIGAGHPTYISMSKYFRELGWRCIGIDANAKFVKMHIDLGYEVYNVACADYEGVSSFKIYNTGHWDEENEGISFSALDLRYKPAVNYDFEEVEIRVTTLNSLLDSIGVKTLEYISVDVEGWEIEVLKGLDVEKFNTKVIAIEDCNNSELYKSYMRSINFGLAYKSRHNYVYKNNRFWPNPMFDEKPNLRQYTQ